MNCGNACSKQTGMPLFSPGASFSFLYVKPADEFWSLIDPYDQKSKEMKKKGSADGITGSVCNFRNWKLLYNCHLLIPFDCLLFQSALHLKSQSISIWFTVAKQSLL